MSCARELARHVPDLRWATIERGEAIPAPGRGQALVLQRGELSLHVDGRMFEFRRAPAVLVPRGNVALTAMSDVVVAVLDLSRLDRGDLRDAVRELLEDELDRLHAWQAEELRKGDDFFADSQGALVPGPYRFGPYRATLLSFRGDVRGVLPRGLRPIPGLRDRFLVALSQIEHCRALHPATDGREHRYLEVAAFVPCLGPSLMPGFYLPEVYPDAYLPILLGREVYGFAKRMGRVLTERDGFDLIAGGSHRLRVRWREDEGGASAWLHDALGLARRLSSWRRPRLYLRKRIADVRAGSRARTCVDQWVELPFTIDTLDDPVVLADAHATFPDGQWSLPGRCEGGAHVRMAFSFGDGRVVRSRRRSSYP